MRIDVRTPDGKAQSGGRFRVVANGEDVTDRCFYLDTETGRLGLFLRNDKGRFYVDPNDHGRAAQEWIDGAEISLIDTTTLAHQPPAVSTLDPADNSTQEGERIAREVGGLPV